MSMKSGRSRGLLAAAAFAAFSLVGVASGAQAATITIGSSSQNIAFTGLGFGSVLVSINNPLSGNAMFGSDIGTYTLGTASFTAGPQSSGLFPAAGSETLSYIGADGDSLFGTVHWNVVEGGLNQATFFGTLSISALSGDAAFTNNFASKAASIDFTTDTLSPDVTLVTLASAAVSSATISSGEVNPSPVPIPGTLPLLASGLVGLWAYGRNRKGQNQGPASAPAGH
jgi:hypothetical protein